MEDRNILEETLKKIEEKKITPKPKWCFLCEDYFLWFLTAVAIVVGTLALSVILFLVAVQDREIYKYLQENFFERVLLSVPYFWIFVLAVLFIFGYYVFKSTKKGYRYQNYMALGAGLLIILFFAFAAFATDISFQIHSVLSQEFPIYSYLTHDKDDDAPLWYNPEKGLLTGKITSVEDGNNFTLSDKNGKTWNIKLNTEQLPKTSAVKAGQTVRLAGTAGNDIFLANYIYK